MLPPADDSLAARIAALPPLREAIRASGLVADRALGQNFLLDRNLLDRIAGLVPLRAGETVYEVGPGPGGLTRALLKAGARVVAVERDGRAIAALQELAELASDRLRLVAGDALKVDAPALAGEGAHIAANLPYNIATPLLVGWLSGTRWPPWWRSATLMFQREVAERIVARPGSPAYGRLAVLAAFRADSRICLRLPPQAFTPAPRVESAVVQLVPRAPLADVDVAVLEALTARAFAQRRKMLRQSLKADLPALLELGIDPSRRPETLAPQEFADLAVKIAPCPGALCATSSGC
ncbi:MAG: 16S rRNA (adenine(1518)-N(6)/adenine(1519)-N(6))-dimethyltransferase RsmA [Sphingomonadaceae bacterium]